MSRPINPIPGRRSMKQFLSVIAAALAILAFTCVLSSGMMKSTGIVKPADKAKTSKANIKEDKKAPKDAAKGKKVEKKEVLKTK